MDGHEDLPVLFTLDGEGWSVRVRDRRLIFVNGASAIDVPVEGLLRWSRDGEDVTFDDVLGAVPAGLHGWISMAALIGLRHTLGGQLLAAALPPGYADWRRIAERAVPLVAWMEGLGRLDDVEVPPFPDTIDDGLSEELGEGAPRRR